MNSIISLEKKMQSLTEQLNDVFHASSLNLKALSVQIKDQSYRKILEDSNREFNNAIILFKSREDLRLNYLISEQIKQQQAKVRRQRLMEYQEKIYDQRRLISDKQAFYESLVKPKKKKPTTLTPQQFKQIRMKEIAEEQQRNLNILIEQIQQLSELQEVLNQQNKRLETYIEEQNRNKQTNIILKQQQQHVKIRKFHQLPLTNLNSKKTNLQDNRQLINTIFTIKQQNTNLLSELEQEKQMYKYLKWENDQLLKKYKKQSSQFRQEKFRTFCGIKRANSL